MSFIQKISSIFSSGEQAADDCFLGLDIGIASVKASIFYLEKNEEKHETKAVVIGFGEAKIKQTRTRQEFEREIIKACYLAKKEAENMAGAIADKAIIGAPAKFVKCSTNIFDFTRDKPEKIIDVFEIKNLLQRAQWKIFDKIRQKEDLESGVLETEVRLLSGEIAGIKIGQYGVVDPVGFEGEKISIAILNTYAPRSFLKIIQNLNKFLGVEILNVVSHNRAALEAISEELLKAGNIRESSCFIVDCRERTTDISVAHKGFFIGPKAIGMGGTAFSRFLAKKFNLPLKEAEKLKQRYISGELSAQIKRKITDAFGIIFNIWLKGIAEATYDFSKILNNMPHLFFLYGSESPLFGFKKKLESQDWQKKFNFNKPIKIKNITAADISGVEDRTGLLNRPDTISLLALAKFSLHFFRKETGLDSILNRVIRLMQN